MDAYTRHGDIRADGRLVHDLYLMRVKAPEQSNGAWDLWEKVETIDAGRAFPPLATSRCPLVRDAAIR